MGPALRPALKPVLEPAPKAALHLTESRFETALPAPDLCKAIASDRVRL